MSSFKSPQPSPLGLVLSLARSLGVVSTDEDLIFTPVHQWHAMHERHEADQAKVEAAETALFHITALIWSERDPRMKRGDLITASELADHLDGLHDDLRSALARVVEVEATVERLTAELATLRGQP